MNDFLFYSALILGLLQIPIIFFLVLIIRQMGVIYLHAMSSAGIPIGGDIPEFAGRSILSGHSITNTTILDKPTLLVFISPNCKRCKELLPHWNEAYELYHDQFNFVLIGYGKEEPFNALLKKRTIKGEMLVNKQLLHAFKAKLVAFGYFIDTDGKVQRKGLCENMQEIKSLLAV